MDETDIMEGEEAIALMREREEQQRLADLEETARAQEMLAEQREAKDKEIEELKARKEARRIEREKEMEIIKQHAAERRARQQEEAKRRKEEAEKKKKEREASRRAMINPLAFKGTGMSKFDEDRKFLMKDDSDFAEERNEAIEKRVPPLTIDGLGEQDLRELAAEMLRKLKRKYGLIFDKGRILKKREYVFNELTTRIRAKEEDAYKERQAKATGVSKYSSDGTFQPLQNFTPDQRRESIMSSGGVMGRMQMFGGGGAHKPDIAEGSEPNAQ
ncbi:uncharacterized protein [Apostichopus japonicus]|uniref:uncharacterized protein isoform X2 n=1 Tax=Stichopus japonicus TaxID=307972 RepID=UPI003AB658E2